MEAIISATRYPVEIFRMQNTLGTIEKGKIADLVLLDADPLKDIGNTRKITAVIVNGRFLSRAKLRRMWAGMEAGASGK
jgi:imidazolonepropionase-like amidohydrolase